MHVFLTCFFSRNNSTTTHIRIYLNERELAKERMEVTFISVPVTQGSRARQRENPGLQRELSGQTSGWGDGPMEAAAKLPLLLWMQVLVCATSQSLNKWQHSELCVAWKIASVFSHTFSVVYLCIEPSTDTHRSFTTLSNSPVGG